MAIAAYPVSIAMTGVTWSVWGSGGSGCGAIVAIEVASCTQRVAAHIYYV